MSLGRAIALCLMFWITLLYLVGFWATLTFAVVLLLAIAALYAVAELVDIYLEWSAERAELRRLERINTRPRINQVRRDPSPHPRKAG